MTLAPYPVANRKRPVLDYNYQYSVTALIYDTLITTDDKYKKLHNSKEFKFFSFSRLEIPERRAQKEGLEILCNDAYLWLTSVDDQLIHTLAGQLLQKGDVHIGGVDFRIVNVLLLDSFEPKENREVFRTMSPIILRTTEGQNGDSRTIDLAPDDERFSRNLIANLTRKFEMFYDQTPSEEIEVVSMTNTKQKRLRIMGTYHRAHHMDIELKGPPELLEFAYECGLGEKNSMGFGMIERRI